MADLIRSPFPGMDPYLEQTPGDVLHSLVVKAADSINPHLPNDLVARIQVLPSRRRLLHILPARLDGGPVCVLVFRHPEDGLGCTLKMAGVEWQGNNRVPACVVNLFRIGFEGGGHSYCQLLIGGGEAEMVSFPLRERLPRIRIPLRPTDLEVTLDLQDLVDRTYHFGAYYRTINYHRDPHPPLTGDDAAWADALLKAAGKR